MSACGLVDRVKTERRTAAVAGECSAIAGTQSPLFLFFSPRFRVSLLGRAWTKCISLHLSMLPSRCQSFPSGIKLQKGCSACQSAHNRIVHHGVVQRPLSPGDLRQLLPGSGSGLIHLPLACTSIAAGAHFNCIPTLSLVVLTDNCSTQPECISVFGQESVSRDALS